MGLLQRITHTVGHEVKHADFSPGKGLLREAVATGVGIGASYGIGQIHGRYRDVEHIEHAPLAVGIVGKALALVAHATVGPGLATAAANGIAQAGLNAHFLSMGLAHGLKGTGRKMLMLAPGTDAKGLASEKGRDTVLGEIPPPASGRYLNRTQVADLARHV